MGRLQTALTIDRLLADAEDKRWGYRKRHEAVVAALRTLAEYVLVEQEPAPARPRELEPQEGGT